MAIFTAEQLRGYLQSDMPDVLAPLPTHPPHQEETARPEGKGKHAASKPDFLTTSDTVVLADHIAEVAVYMRDAIGYTYLSDIAVVDYLDDGIFELVYRFYTLDGGAPLVLKVRVPRMHPRVPSITHIFPGANFHEREGYDLFGINFVGHPYLRRIYMWDEFMGHPMRKDFQKQGDKYLNE